MKLRKACIATCAIMGLLLSHQVTAQTSPSQSGFGIGIKGSTNGFGADLIYAFTTPISVRLGFETLGTSITIPFDEQGISYVGDLGIQTGSISLLADFYFGQYFFVTGGVAKSLLKVEFDGKADKPFPFGDIEIPIEMIGDFGFEMKPESGLMPYLGLGVGRTLGLNKKVGFAFELGSFYQGPLGMTINSSGLLSPTSNPDHGHAERLKKQVDQYVWYPIAKLSLSYKFANL